MLHRRGLSTYIRQESSGDYTVGRAVEVIVSTFIRPNPSSNVKSRKMTT